MRTAAINGMSGEVYSLTIPNDNIWLYDNNIVKIHYNGEGRFGAKVTLTNEHTGEVKYLAYRSDLPDIIFDLNTTLMSLFNDQILNELTLTIECFYGDLITADGTYATTTTLLKGKSYSSESHACERVIYLYYDSDIERVEIYFEASGTVTIGNSTYEVQKGFNWLDLSGDITAEGTYTLNYVNAAATPVVTVADITVGCWSATAMLSVKDSSGTLPSNSKKGGIWSDSVFVPSSYNIQLVYEPICEDNNIFHFNYINSDGCVRHLAGKLKEEVNESSFTDYEHYSDDTVLRNIPYHLIVGSSQTVKVVFTDIDRLSYFNHILDSEMITFDNYNYDVFPCIIKTNKITKTTEESQDFELEIVLIRN